MAEDFKCFKQRLTRIPTKATEDGVLYILPTKEEYEQIVRLTPPTYRLLNSAIEFEHTQVGFNGSIILTYKQG